MKTAGILCVFQGFQKAELRQKSRRSNRKGILVVTE
jgi:hypothetical protein